MTRQEARERLEGTFMFERHNDKILLRDVALIQAVEAYERDAQRANRPQVLPGYAAPVPAPFSG